MIQHDTIDARAALQEGRLGLFIRAMDLEVVLQFPRPHQAGVERLMTLVVRVTAMFEEAATWSSRESKSRGSKSVPVPLSM